jgi:hypothetical protein
MSNNVLHESQVVVTGIERLSPGLQYAQQDVFLQCTHRKDDRDNLAEIGGVREPSYKYST